MAVVLTVLNQNAFADFTAAGGLVVAAAGNDGNNVRSYPAGYPSVMMIGANDNNDQIADFSQFPSCTSGKGKRVTEDETICVESDSWWCRYTFYLPCRYGNKRITFCGWCGNEYIVNGK